MVKKSETKVETRFCKLQFSGSLGDGEGIGKRSVCSLEVMRKTLPGRIKDLRSDGSVWSMFPSIVGPRTSFDSL